MAAPISSNLKPIAEAIGITLNKLFDEFYFNIKGKEIDEVRKNEVINILEDIEGKVQ